MSQYLTMPVGLTWPPKRCDRCWRQYAGPFCRAAHSPAQIARAVANLGGAR